MLYQRCGAFPCRTRAVSRKAKTVRWGHESTTYEGFTRNTTACIPPEEPSQPPAATAATEHRPAPRRPQPKADRRPKTARNDMANTENSDPNVRRTIAVPVPKVRKTIRKRHSRHRHKKAKAVAMRRAKAQQKKKKFSISPVGRCGLRITMETIPLATMSAG